MNFTFTRWGYFTIALLTVVFIQYLSSRQSDYTGEVALRIENFQLSRKSPPPSTGPKSPGLRALFTDERLQYEYDMLKNPATGKIPEGIRQVELSQAFRAPQFNPSQRGAGFTVAPRGPNNLGGRTRAIAFDVRYASNNTILAGGVSSGVYKTTNGGTSWTKVSSNDDIHNVTAIAQDPRSGQEDTWYYTTGEPTGNSASLGSSYRGTGFWKSTDNGNTWTFLGNSNTGSLESFDDCADYSTRIVVDPTNGNVYAAILGQILRSTDGGNTWASVVGPGCGGSSLMTDIVVTSTGRLYAGFSGSHGSASDGVWTSTSGNAGTWTRIAGNGTPAGWNTSGNYGRIVLAIAPSDEDILFALYYRNFSSDCGGTSGVEAELFRWDQGTTAWANLTANLPDEAGCLNGNDPFAVQGGYDLVVGVKPNDANTVFVGGTNIYRSTDGFTSTSNTTRIGGYAGPGTYAKYANHHPDIHVIAFAPNNNNVLYSGSDGGIHSADITAGTPSWTSLNNDYVTYQYYHVAIDPANGSDYVIGGTQDNGTTESTSGTSHSEIWSGDGVSVGIASSSLVYFGTQNGSVRRNGTFIRPSGTSNSIFVTQFFLDPDNTEIFYYADGQDLYRTSSASTVSPSTGWTLMTAINGAITNDIRAWEVTRGGGYNSSDASRKLYLGTENGTVLRLNDPAFTAAGTAPVDITPGSAGSGVVSDIAVNPNDDNEILVTYSNYGINSVFHTTNANSATPSWTNVEGNISQASFRSATVMEEGGITYYIVGTSIGLYCTSTLNGGSTTWTRIGAGSIGFALTSSLAHRAGDNFLLVGTHGNGMFMVEPPRDPVIAFDQATSTETETTTASFSCRNFTDVSIQMNILAPPTGDATVTITNTGTATEGADYLILNPGKQLTFADGATTPQNVSIRIFDETGDEADETIILDFVVSGPTDASKAAFNQTHTLTIVDNDLTPAASFPVFEEDFESGAPGWGTLLFSGWTAANQWIWGNNGGMSGSGSVYCSSDGVNPVYDNNTQDNNAIVTPLIDATAFAGMEITFDFKSNGESGADYGRLTYSTNGSTYFTFDGNSTGPYTGVSAATQRTVALPNALDNTSFYLAWRWTNDDNGTGGNPPFTIDNIDVHTTSGTVLETVLNSTDEQYFGPFETVHFYDGNEIMVTLKNNSSYDYGCTTVTIDRAGTGAQSAWSLTSGHELADKTVLVTPTNNSPGGSDSYDITLYYTDAEFNGWVANSDPTHTTSDFKLVKSTGPISGLSPVNQNAVLNGVVTYAALGSDHTFTATFTGGFSGFGGGNPSNPFPVEFLEFTAIPNGNQVDLAWITAWEINNDRFEIERSADGEIFQKVGFVKGQGDTQEEIRYEFTDYQPFSGRNFYRLRQVDIDGSFAFSDVVEVTLATEIAMNISPNPFDDFLMISGYSPRRSEWKFELLTQDGKSIITHNLIEEGNWEKRIPVPTLPHGIYLYRISGERESFSGKLIRARD